eukprot:CAMPEP_0115092840 /NCGR_PEP_ID=MMETSP0227-20121206/27056_1 /TAXON_ID=89957 /ORGANISM="Polarella glacialis, Strain CCMP 1383" /LENGTH=312 /DNA_ID=CAMNT_0002484837 /DNA_START=64 /DNA_END=1002 /DNA_ORIENTATION=-
MRASKRATNATNTPATGSPISESQAPPVEDQSRQACLHRQLHKTKFCTYNLKGACHYGNECAFAHSCVELQVTPDLRRTQLCKAFLEATCVDPECIFAHGDEELISTGMFHKKMLCKWNEKGKCRNGDQCRFAHGTWELRIDHAKTAPKSDPMTPLKASASNKGKETGGGKQQMPMKVLPPSAVAPVEPAFTSVADRVAATMQGNQQPQMPMSAIWPSPAAIPRLTAFEAWQMAAAAADDAARNPQDPGHTRAAERECASRMTYSDLEQMQTNISAFNNQRLAAGRLPPGPALAAAEPPQRRLEPPGLAHSV